VLSRQFRTCVTVHVLRRNLRLPAPVCLAIVSVLAEEGTMMRWDRRLPPVAAFAALAFFLPTPFSPSASFAATFTVIHTFVDGSAKGYWPSGQLAMDKKGALYGTTGRGGGRCPAGEYSCGGTVYMLVRPAKGKTAWPYKVIADFGGTDGSYPVSGVMRAKSGALYGATEYGGDVACTFEPHHWGCGTLFRLVPPAAGSVTWEKTVLHRFSGSKDGRFPTEPPVSYGTTKFFGTTADGGSSNGGVMYELVKPGASASLGESEDGLEFAALGPSRPIATPIVPGIDPVWGFITPFSWYFSNIGGAPATPEDCGEYGDAVTNADGQTVCQCLFGTDGLSCASPFPVKAKLFKQEAAAVARPFKGNGSFYGVASMGGDSECVGSGNQGCGVVYQFVPKAGGGFTYHVRYSFQGGKDGYWPNGKLTIGPDGSLYGTTKWGGKSCPIEPTAGRGCGTVFRLRPPTVKKPGWTMTILYRFTGGKDGAFPAGGVLLGVDGALYGATTNGGGCAYDQTRGCGTLFRLKPPVAPSQHWTRTILHRFLNKGDGMEPDGHLIYDNTGAIYGTALDVVFKVAP
jgi:hypothetical protein